MDFIEKIEENVEQDAAKIGQVTLFFSLMISRIPANCSGIAANGVTHCPNTGTPYSLIYIVKEFTDHDNHNKRQIIKFLKENNLG